MVTNCFLSPSRLCRWECEGALPCQPQPLLGSAVPTAWEGIAAPYSAPPPHLSLLSRHHQHCPASPRHLLRSAVPSAWEGMCSSSPAPLPHLSPLCQTPSRLKSGKAARHPSPRLAETGGKEKGTSTSALRCRVSPACSLHFRCLHPQPRSGMVTGSSGLSQPLSTHTCPSQESSQGLKNNYCNKAGAHLPEQPVGCIKITKGNNEL